MKILAITSGRINGNTQMAALALARELAALTETHGGSACIENINLGKEELLFCRGCRACFEKGEARCPCKDSAMGIAQKMREADAIIMASPVYVEDVSGSMKNFIDRMAYNCYRPAFALKAAYVITTSGVGSTLHASKTIKVALGLWGYSVIGALKLRMGDRMDEEVLNSRYGKAISAAAKRMYAQIEKGAPRPSIRSLIVFKVQQTSWQKNKAQSVTQDYWMNQGWLNDRCTYYVHHRKNRAATAIARTVGRVVALFFV